MPENPEKDPIQQAIEDAAAAAAARKAEREALNEAEQDAQAAIHTQELEGLQGYNTALYQNQGQILQDIEGRLSAAKHQDEEAQRRERAFRYISGLGDTLASLANLVGTAHSASNQNQTYNSHAVVQKAEAARKARKLEMDDLSKRQSEMMERLREMQAAGSLAEVQMKARQARDTMALAGRQAAAEQAAAQADSALIRQAERDARADFVADRAFDENVRQFNESQERLATNAAADRAARTAIAAAEIEAKVIAAQKKYREDPKMQSKTLQKNLVGIRDELAKKMGYENYNDYLRHKSVSGWGKDYNGQRNKITKDIREKRSAEFPEIEEFLELLNSPEELTEAQIASLIGASEVFADAVNNATVEPEERTENGKKKVW